jgi:tripartite-type tricarboxylate transporter receptor subunit TctC
MTPLVFALLGFALLQPERAPAQSYPVRSVSIICGTAAGGQSDRIARLVGQYLGELWGSAVVVENRPGADTTIAAERVAHAAPDGYTLLIAGQSNLALAAVQGGSQLRYDPIADFAPIGRVARVPLVVAVNSSVKATTIAELVGYARARPGQLSYASTGMVTRLGAELLKAAEGLDILEIPYKSQPAALADLLTGRIDMMFVDLSVVVPHADAGALRLLAAAGSRRAAAAPNLPTLAEFGIRGVAVDPWYGFVAPARTPPEVLARLRSGLADVRRMPEFRQRLQQIGYEPIDDSPEQMAAEIVGDIHRFSGIVKSAGIKGASKD